MTKWVSMSGWRCSDSCSGCSSSSQTAQYGNIAYLRATGTGKDHFREALGQAAIEDGRTVVWFIIEDVGALMRGHRGYVADPIGVLARPDFSPGDGQFVEGAVTARAFEVADHFHAVNDLVAGQVGEPER